MSKTRIIRFEMEVTEDEFANFLSRASGADGRKVVSTPVDDETDVPNESAPATDKNGVAWDARFHASTKALNADGSWKRRRGLSDAEKAEADAYDNTGGNAPAETPTVPAEPAAPIPSVPAAPSELPAAPSLPPVGMPGLPAAEPTPVSYEELVALFQKVKPEHAANFQKLYADAGVTDPNALTTDGALRIKLADVLKAHS